MVGGTCKKGVGLTTDQEFEEDSDLIKNEDRLREGRKKIIENCHEGV